jgi:uncharacterized protein (DUF2164 family)
LFVSDEAEIEKIKREFEFSQKKKILTDIRDYLWRKMTTEISDTYYFSKREVWETAMRDLGNYAKNLGVEL